MNDEQRQPVETSFSPAISGVGERAESGEPELDEAAPSTKISGAVSGIAEQQDDLGTSS